MNESTASPATPPRSNSTTWLRRSASISLALGGVCWAISLAATLYGTLAVFSGIAETGVPPAAEVARGLVLALRTAPLALLGTVLLILGFVLRLRAGRRRR
jgi:hypothetical protein